MKNISNNKIYAILHATGNINKLFSLYKTSHNIQSPSLKEFLQQVLFAKLDEFDSKNDSGLVYNLLAITVAAGLEKEVILSNIKNKDKYRQIHSDEYGSEFESSLKDNDSKKKDSSIQEKYSDKSYPNISIINKLKAIDSYSNTSFISFLLGFINQNKKITKRSIFLKLELLLLKLYMNVLTNSALITVFKHAINTLRIKRRLLADRELLYDVFDAVFMQDDADSQKIAALMLNERLIDVNNLYTIIDENYLHQAVQRDLVEFFKELDSSIILHNLKLKNIDDLDIFSLALSSKCEEIATIIKQKVMQNEDAAIYIKEKL